MRRTLKWLFVSMLLLLPLTAARSEVSVNLRTLKEYSASGKVTKITYVDAKGNAAMAEDLGYAMMRYEYRDDRYLVKTSLFDEKGRPVNGKEGWSVFSDKKNYHGLSTEKAYYNAAGKLVIGPEGFARQKNEVDYKSILKTN